MGKSFRYVPICGSRGFLSPLKGYYLYVLFTEELTRIAPPPLEKTDEDKEMIRLRPYQKFPSNSAEATKCDGYVGRSTPSQEAPLGAKDL